jgi:hypothetical protein
VFIADRKIIEALLWLARDADLFEGHSQVGVGGGFDSNRKSELVLMRGLNGGKRST